MTKKYFRRFSIVAGILLLLLIIANFGLNFWLKNNLDDYIKKNSDYIVSYKKLDVDLGTGNIFLSGVTINNKNPHNLDILGFQGTVDTLSVARLGIIDAVFNKKISTSDLVLNNPNLNIILPEKKNQKKNRQQSEIALENIKITNGNIQVFKATKQKFLSVKDFNLMVDNLQMSEETAEGKLPFIFDEYEISGKNFFFRPDNVYAFTAKYITTTNGQMSLKDFAMTPLLSYANFTKFYPKKRNLFDFKSSEMEFKDIILKDDKITLTKVRFESPDLKMFTTNVKPLEKKKSFTYNVQLQDVLFNNAKINILNPNGTPLFAAGNLTMKINKFAMNEETAKGNIPFEYDDFSIAGQKVNYVSPTQNVHVASLLINQKVADLRSISIKPTSSRADKTLMNLAAQQVHLKFNEWNFADNKLKLNIENVLVNQLHGKITAGNLPKKTAKPTFAGISFPLVIKNVSLKNSNLEYEKGKQPLMFKDLNANIQNIELNEKTVKEAIPFKMGFYSLSTRNFNYRTKFYNMSSSLLKVNKNTMQISNFAMVPTVSRAQFIRMIPAEKDLYNIKANQISVNGRWDFFSANKFLEASEVKLNGVNANIFRSKIPKDDLTEKPLYSKLLRTIKIPMYIQNLGITNSLLVYEEDTKKSEGPGKLTFNNFNLTARNINSGKMKGKPTNVPINIDCRFMNASPMKVKWNFNTADLGDSFAISGNVEDLPASRINPFIEPYLKVRATGLIKDLIFHFKGNPKGLNGGLQLKHQDLKIAIIKETGEKNEILSAVANIFVRSNSDKYPDAVQVEDVERDPTKSFFNLFWKGIEQGLKKTLIGLNAPKTEESIKKTVKEAKTTVANVKSDIKDANSTVKNEIQTIKGSKNDSKRKKPLRNIFKKKSEK